MRYVKGGLLLAIIGPKFSRFWSSVLCLAAQNRSDRADRWLLLLLVWRSLSVAWLQVVGICGAALHDADA